MITEQPEEWESPLGDWFKTLVDEKPTIKVRTPSGSIITMPRREFDSKVAVGLSLTEVQE